MKKIAIAFRQSDFLSLINEVFILKKRFIIIVFLIISFLPLNACSPKDIMYLLEYNTGYQNVIFSENKDGIFYVLEKPLELSGSYGKIVIESCYYEYNLGFNFYYTFETDNPVEIEKMANDSKHSLYAKASVKEKEMDLISYGYTKNETGNSDKTIFELMSGYKYTSNPSQAIIIFEFMNESFEIELTEKQGYSIDTIQGKKLWDSITNKKN